MEDVTKELLVAPARLVHGPFELADCIHCMLPVFPISVSVVVFPAQIVEGDKPAVPATGVVNIATEAPPETVPVQLESDTETSV